MRQLTELLSLIGARWLYGRAVITLESSIFRTALAELRINSISNLT